MPAKLSPREAGMASPRLDEIASEIRTTWARVERDTAITRERLCEARDICRKNRVSFITWIATGNIGISQAQVYRLLGPDLVVVERKTHGHDGELIVGKVAQNQDVETDYGKARFFGTEAPSQTPAWHEPQVLLYQGNSLDRLKEINEAEVEVDICITSPPYFQKFDYGLHGQCGHEDTVADFIATQVLARIIHEGLAVSL
jgi:hypothetical protein